MIDDLQNEINHQIELLKAHKESLRVLEVQFANQGDLHQNQPNFNAIRLTREQIRSTQWEVARLTLLPLLCSINVSKLRQIYNTSFESTKPPADLHFPDTMAILKALFMEISDSIVRERFFSLVMGDYPRLKQALSTQLQTYGSHLDLYGLSALSQMTTTTSRHHAAVLLIALDPNPQIQENFHLKAWLWRDSEDCESIANGDFYTSSLDEMKPHIIAVYNDVISKHGIDSTHLTLEFFLPLDLLAQPIHLWSVAIADDISSDLGYEHPVHVRFYERTFKRDGYTKKARDMWKDKWTRLDQTTVSQIKKLSSTQYLVDLKGLYRLLNESMCYVELCGIHTHYHARKALALAGIGVGLWLAESDHAADYDYAFLDAFIDTLHLDGYFPATMYDLRRHKQWAESIVVLWDDPERRPVDVDDPNYQLSSM